MLLSSWVAGVRRIFTSDSLSSTNMLGSVGKSKTYTVRVGRRGKEAWLAVEGMSNVSGQAVGSMTQLDVSPVLYIGMLARRETWRNFRDLSIISRCVF